MSEHLFHLHLFRELALASTDTLESPVCDLRHATPVSLTVLHSAIGGDPDVKIEVAYSLEGDVFSAYEDSDPVIASTLSAFGETPQGVHTLNIELQRQSYMKFRVTGTDANAAGTILDDIALNCTEVI